MGVAGISLIDLLPKDSGCLFRLFALVILFVLLAFFTAIATYHHSKDGVHLLINGMDVDIVVDDLFAAEGVKVIPFDEYFDIKVDDKVISKNSLNGIFVEKYADRNALKQVVEERQPSLLKPYKAGMAEFAILSALLRIATTSPCSPSPIWMKRIVLIFIVVSMKNVCSICGTNSIECMQAGESYFRCWGLE